MRRIRSERGRLAAVSARVVAALLLVLRALGFGQTPCLQLATLLPALALAGLLLGRARRRLGEGLGLHAIACALVLYAVASANFRVHLTSGVLPRKSLQLARDWVRPGLAVMAPSVTIDRIQPPPRN